MKTRSVPCRFAFLILLAGGLSALGASPSTVREPGDLRAAGKIDFPVSCKPETQEEFSRGVALLHSFFYEEARRIFTEVAEQDPKCAMAQWGIAMTWWHPIWTPPTSDEMKAGKAAIDKAMAMGNGSDREGRFIAALHAYYHAPDPAAAAAVGQSCHGPVGPRDRVVAYEKAMRDLLEHYPDDFEIETFYALARLSVGYATPNDTSLSNQLAAAQILEKLWTRNPNHPGVVHYLIHSYDYPALAQRGLPAAKAYASIAPWVPHALHMPSHIFTRLGMWDESIAANRASADASRAYAAKRHREATEAEELHALDYMAYAYLQEGQDTKAKEIVDFAATVRKTNPELEFSAAYALAAIPARFALERSDWNGADGPRVCATRKACTRRSGTGRPQRRLRRYPSRRSPSRAARGRARHDVRCRARPRRARRRLRQRPAETVRAKPATCPHRTPAARTQRDDPGAKFPRTQRCVAVPCARRPGDVAAPGRAIGGLRGNEPHLAEQPLPVLRSRRCHKL